MCENRLVRIGNLTQPKTVSFFPKVVNKPVMLVM